jgi:hypothetical protein
MANVLFLTESTTNACSFYRVAGVVKDLRRKMPDDDFTVVQWNQIELHWATIMNFDIIMAQRPFTKGHLDFCQFVKSVNIPLWLDYDDNLFCVPPENKAHWVYDSPEVHKTIQEIMKLANVITVTNSDLKQSLLPFNKNIEIIPNAFNDTILKRGILPQRSHMVLWRGTDTHIYDLQVYANAINKATVEFKEKQFLYMGFYPYFLMKNAETLNMFVQKDQDIVLYFLNTFKLAPLCVHVPLVDELFNRCKSDIAFIEGAYFGAVCNVPHWWNAPGAFKYTDQKSYYENMRTILSGEVDIEAQNRISWEYIQDNLLLSRVNIKRVELINNLL